MERTLRGKDETGLCRARHRLNPSNETVSSDSIPGRLANAMAKFAARIAVSAPAGQWTYAELHRRSSLVAAQILQRLGETSGPVALLMEHDAPLIAAILGTVRANKLYLALDPAHSAGQLAAMLAGSGAKLLLADESNWPWRLRLRPDNCRFCRPPKTLPRILRVILFPRFPPMPPRG